VDDEWASPVIELTPVLPTRVRAEGELMMIISMQKSKAF